MSERMDNEQLKAKIGQILYNEFITGRLKEEVLGQFLSRGAIDLSYSLGRDSNGEEICISARVFRLPASLEKDKVSTRALTPRPGKRKFVLLAMSTEKSVVGNNETLRNGFDGMLSQSLPWWDRYNARGVIDIRDWRLERTIVVDGKGIVSALKSALKEERSSETRKQDALSDLA